MNTDDGAALSVVGFNLFWLQFDYDGGAEMIERAILANPITHALTISGPVARVE